jgi:phage baseplate assembly protein gpV
MNIPGLGGNRRRIYGVVIGIVTDNKHPDGEYRVKVRFPWIRDKTDAGDEEDFISTWCRIATPMAGPGRGFYWLPEAEDEVLISFEHGDLRRGYVIGALWNGKDLPPVGDNAPEASTDPMGVDLGIADACVDTKDNEKNRARFMYSRSGHLFLMDDADEDKDEKIVLKTARGHTIVLNDKDGNESIAIYDSTGDEYLYIDEKNKKITIETKDGDIDILCKNGTLNIEAKEITTKASDKATHEATNKMEHKSKEVVIKGDSKVDVDGGKIELN